MKFSENWLREWVNPKLDRDALSLLLTNSGLEVEDITQAAETFTGVCVGQIKHVKKHSEKENLYICEVDVAESSPLTIVCGAKNVKVGMKVAVAKVNAVLPGNIIINTTNIGEVSSQGMLLSSKELALTDESDTIMELPTDALLGQDFWQYFKLEDHIFDVGITPNRGDCLSVSGFAREVSALTRTSLKEITISPIKDTIKDQLKVTIQAEQGCPHYVGRIIQQVKADAITPAWIQERLRRSGIRAISPIVDIANYVMLELGQPMHAFDLDKLTSEIIVRQSKKNEKIVLLDGSKKILNADTLVIADKENPLAIAGVMGGVDSSITLLTKSIFLESAYFAPEAVAKSRQYYNLTSDSAYRYERGVDPALQRRAIERVSQLIIEVCGGSAGPIIDVKTKYYPRQEKIILKKDQVTQLLGIQITDEEIEKIFDLLQIEYQKSNTNTWEVQPPSFRFDIKLPEDLIEEIGRVYGFDKIPIGAIKAELRLAPKTNLVDTRILRSTLCDLGYQEVITYSFIDKTLQKLLDPNEEARELINPITNEMIAMRTSLWPGLIKIMSYNLDRQQTRVRLFEIGKIFLNNNQQIQENLFLAGLMTGLNFPEQWGIPSREADFYDLKGNVEMLFKRLKSQVSFQQEDHAALQKGQSAAIYLSDLKVGMLGSLHPFILRELGIKQKAYVFALNLDLLKEKEKIMLQEISKFPEIRRDIAIIVNQAVPSQTIQDTIKQVAGDWLKDNFIFDVYQGKGISSGCKSVALALVLQHPTRTMTDAEIADLMERVIIALKGQLGAELRS